ncbi:MaoC/PaaZ C-terminal domain-containing protein [Desertibacillus haloalkaliphilus]|uniref:MaoC/PaaZ C-terminal domain-containing protein n=1 Tax=Desertibacillus haloalkaliphilus TaxID=1328930 RepID=UPI001C258BB7|nr:MaoC/PaaZ C-terminal domain-containing protein [Desertibacillus haloalkaliphilus]MBU8906062.1 MaoC family dehydratase N-terminal domain-containing protein [Desertibacillus haloalkaliphilus]
MSITINDMFIGQVASHRRAFTETDVKLCNELTQDFSPVYHVNENVWKCYYEKPIVPGLLTEGLITQVISQKLPGSASILLQKELIYYHPVHVGDEITAELEVIDINEARNWVTQKVTCFNQQGNEVIKGQVVILVLETESN